jgi:hypothetical protein
MPREPIAGGPAVPRVLYKVAGGRVVCPANADRGSSAILMPNTDLETQMTTDRKIACTENSAGPNP